jgi:hypothetical protein
VPAPRTLRGWLSSPLLRFGTSAALTGYVLWLADVRQVGAAFGRATAGWILAAVALVIVDRSLMAWRWIALLLRPASAAGPPLSALIRTFFVSTFAGTFLPASVGGDVVRAWGASRDGVPASRSIAAVLMDRLLGVVSILLAAAGGLWLLPPAYPRATADWAFAVASGTTLLALAVVFVPAVEARLRGGLARVAFFTRAAHALLDALAVYRRESRRLVLVLAASVAVQGLRVVQAYCLGRSLGIPADLVVYSALIPMVLFVMLLPVSINGLGTSQAAFVWLFGPAGVDPAAAFTLSVLFVALGFVGNLPGAVLYVLPRADARRS